MQFLGVYHDIRCQLSSSYAKEVEENRAYMHSMINVVLLHGKQGLAFRGHNEGEASTNRGNFLEIINLLSMYDYNVAKRPSVQNANYTSPEVQNDLISIIATCVRRDNVIKLVEAGWFSLLVNETKDLSKTEQLSICLRYLLDGEPVEEFLNFVPTEKLDAKSLSQIIVSTLQRHGIDIKKFDALKLFTSFSPIS